MRPLALDLALIVLFAALGRRTHDEGSAIGGILLVAAPFAVAWAGAYLALRPDRPGASWRRAAGALAIALPVAFALRAATGRGLAPGFLVVAAVFLGTALVARRVLVAAVRRRTSAGR